jgi:hypothetical protein
MVKREKCNVILNSSEGLQPVSEPRPTLSGLFEGDVQAGDVIRSSGNVIIALIPL